VSRSPDLSRTSRRGDDGFSLIEVVVALGILMIVVVTLLPQLIVGIQATGTARLVTQSKGIAQAELERMRNLPYHISSEAGNYRDVLDFYYTNLTTPTVTPGCTSGGGYAAPQAGWTGYVSPTGARCSYEPATGAFYRTVRQVPAANGIAAFTVVVGTQFLSGATPPQPVTPTTGYNTQTTAGGRPASHQIGVTVTVLYADRATLKPASTFTQISNQLPATTRVRAEAAVTALQVGSVTLDNGPVSLSSGLVNLTGSLTYASTVTGNVAGISAGLATGATSVGTSETVSAPPSTTATVRTPGAGSLGTTGCEIACWGGTRLELPAMSAAAGLPNAGSPSTPAQALLVDTVNSGISFGNSPSTGYRPGLRLALPLLELDPDASAVASGIAVGCAPGTTGAASYSTGTGYLRTTAVDAVSEPSVVDACVVARTSSLSLFPVDIPDAEGGAPRGVVLVELRRASARCLVQTTAHTPSTSFDYEAVVKYWDGTAYQTAATVTPATTTDPLDAIDLATTSVGGSKFLGDYIASWSALTGAEVTATAAEGQADVKIPGVVTISTQPVRNDSTEPDGLDPTSVLSVTVGALSCSAMDAR
jgi:Tfp pilus assembly protein PilV